MLSDVKNDQERRKAQADVEKVSAMLYHAAVHLQSKGYEPDLIFAAMINAAASVATNNYGYTEAAEMMFELTGRVCKRLSISPQM
jgi:hypothetical protein